jgi:radical SAM superfamily enzyme
MLHILKNTDLAVFYEKNPFKILSREEYVDLVCDALELLKKDIVIHRLTGDGKKSDLIEPKWTLHKLKVLSDIDKTLKIRESFQGKNFPL